MTHRTGPHARPTDSTLNSVHLSQLWLPHTARMSLACRVVSDVCHTELSDVCHRRASAPSSHAAALGRGASKKTHVIHTRVVFQPRRQTYQPPRAIVTWIVTACNGRHVTRYEV